MSAAKRDPIVVERVIGATIENVFSAWGDSESLASWMCPAETMSRASVETDFRVGGRFQIVMHGEDGDYEQSGEYLEIEPSRRLVFTWSSPWAPDGERETRVTISLEPAGDGKTRLRLVHEDITSFYDNHEGGWATILAKLDDHITGGSSQ